MELGQFKSIALSIILSTSLNGEKNTSQIIDSNNYEFIPYSSSISNVPNIPFYLLKQIPIIHNLDDFNRIDYLTITLDQKSTPADLLWINYCPNLKDLNIRLLSGGEEALRGLIRIPQLTNLSIEYIGSKESHFGLLTLENCSFFQYSPSLKKVHIGDFQLEPGVIETLNQVESLYLDSYHDGLVCNYRIDYTKLKSLKELYIYRPFTTLIHLNLEEANYFKSHGIPIYTNTNSGYQNVVDDFIEYNQLLNHLMEQLDINQDESDLEKLKKLLVLIMNEFSYDGGNYSKKDLIDKFYKDGFLYRTFQDKNIVCGNYSALLSKLLDNLNIDSLLVVRDNHAFNYVQLDEVYYQVDPTFIDNNNQNSRYSHGYIFDSQGKLVDDILHIPVPDIKTENIKEEIEYASNMKFLLFLLAKASIDIALLYGLVHRKSKKEKIKKKKQ